MKIWYQSAVNFDYHPNYRDALKAHFARIASPGTDVWVHGRSAERGRDLLAPDVIRSPIVYHVVVPPIFISALLRAESEGADAFVVGTWSEPILPELRSLARIPVVSMPEATLLAACTSGFRIGIVTLNSLCIPYMEKSVALHRMGSRVSGIHIVDGEPAEHDLDASFATPEVYLKQFRAAFREAARAGAQVIIPAEGVLAMMAAMNGLREADGVPIVDGVGTPVLFAELAVRLRAHTGLLHSPAAYPRPSDASLEALHDLER